MAKGGEIKWGQKRSGVFPKVSRIRLNLLSGLAVCNRESNRRLSRASLNQNSWISQLNIKIQEYSFILWEELSRTWMEIWSSVWRNHFLGKRSNSQGTVNMTKATVLWKALRILMWTNETFKPKVNKPRKTSLSYPLSVIKNFVKYSILLKLASVAADNLPQIMLLSCLMIPGYCSYISLLIISHFCHTFKVFQFWLGIPFA